MLFGPSDLYFAVSLIVVLYDRPNLPTLPVLARKEQVNAGADVCRNHVKEHQLHLRFLLHDGCDIESEHYAPPEDDQYDDDCFVDFQLPENCKYKNDTA